ncbi:hypothetical protein ACH5RR_041461 [Cinchona calisaya]|uniref:Uncharacterized protein n=1 Tax=Cinchona calisaya TaxID=153742 RepID=A0ABD2XWX8_9GENT
MCISSQNIYVSMHNKQSKKCRIQLHQLTRRKIKCEENIGKDMIILKNLKLYIENITILEENEKLRKKATLLHKENLQLMSEIQKQFSPSDRLSATLNLLLHEKEN